MEITIIILIVLIFIVLIFIANLFILAKLFSNNSNMSLAEFVSLITLYSEFLYQIHDKNKSPNEIKKDIYDIIINNIDKYSIAKRLNISINALEIIIAGIVDKVINPE